MEHAQDTFISSTFWSERSGPVAANKTLDIMERTKSWKIITLRRVMSILNLLINIGRTASFVYKHQLY